ncbi:MAG: hypothetical protein HDR20_01195 [Lachnospiraceae bacterium]|nr:hypothetical protein [Lachnospiraceae bacterium]
MVTTMLKNFFKCGLIGWCMEIVFTALDSLRRRDMRLMGQTSLWMFPIYGSACLLSILFGPLKNFPAWLRGSIYAVCIYIGEYLTGAFLNKHKMCPWNYETSRWNIRRIIRLDYFPNWFLAGLLFEKILSKDRKAV